MASITFNVKALFRGSSHLVGTVPGFGRACIERTVLEAGARIPKSKAFRFRIRTPRRNEHGTHYAGFVMVSRAGGTAFPACYLPKTLRRQSVVVEASRGVGHPWRRA